MPNPLGVSSKDLLRARRIAKRRRAHAACFRCKEIKVKCSDYRPCKKCAGTLYEQLCSTGSMKSEISVPAEKIKDESHPNNDAFYSDYCQTQTDMSSGGHPNASISTYLKEQQRKKGDVPGTWMDSEQQEQRIPQYSVPRLAEINRQISRPFQIALGSGELLQPSMTTGSSSHLLRTPTPSSMQHLAPLHASLAAPALLGLGSSSTLLPPLNIATNGLSAQLMGNMLSSISTLPNFNTRWLGGAGWR